MTRIKAIETRYKGCRFRSRLEARWAVFLDTLRIPWEYEKEGFDLGGVCYLPDFWLPRQRQWMECKGERNRDGWRESRLLAEATGCDVAIAHGEFDVWRRDAPEGYFTCAYLWYGDNRCTWPDDPDPAYWGRCPKCGLYGIGHYGHHRLCGCTNHGTPDDPEWVDEQWHWANPDRHESLLAAYAAARSARFEFGETPR